MVIITSFYKNETYGLLGPQIAATIIQDHTSYECIVIAVTGEFDSTLIKKKLADYFGPERPIIGFSALSGREDLFDLAKELKGEGAVTILAGPQADVDFAGEEDWQNHSHRFKGLSDCFTCGLHGPAEQAIGLLTHLDGGEWSQLPGLLYCGRDGNVIQNPSSDWNDSYLGKIRWDNIHLAGKDGFEPLSVDIGQVLQAIGCPHAARAIPTKLDYPVSISGRQEQRLNLKLKGCSFCDVAIDKGYHRKLNIETVISQLSCLPDTGDGKKVPFELINENPLPGLAGLMQEANSRGIELSQINLTLRADWLVKGRRHLKEVLTLAGRQGVYVLLSSIGFESFDDCILRNLNKGLSVEKNIEAVRLIRQMKDKYPHQLGYATREGANHGFIHPTPWDTKETAAAIQKNISLYGLQNDILPPHSTPLIIHHASGLADWIRQIEQREGIYFRRYGSIISWWDEPLNLSKFSQ